MRDDHYYNRRASGGDTFFAFMTGLVLGGLAAFMASADNREKVKETFTDAKKKGQKMLADTTKKAHDLSETVSDSAKDLAERASKELDKAQREVSRRTGGR